MGGFFGPKVPKVDATVAKKTVDTEKKSTSAARKALFATEGAQEGEELMPTQVQKRQSFFGN